MARRFAAKGCKVEPSNARIRFADFKTITRSETLPEPSNTTQEIAGVAVRILSTRLSAEPLGVRLLGVGVSGFDRTNRAQGLLFDQPERQKQKKLDTTIDQITERFGKASLRRASGLRDAD